MLTGNSAQWWPEHNKAELSHVADGGLTPLALRLALRVRRCWVTLRSVANALGYRLRVVFAAGATGIEIITETKQDAAELGRAQADDWVEAASDV